jgi:hypothetical protein
MIDWYEVAEAFYYELCRYDDDFEDHDSWEAYEIENAFIDMYSDNPLKLINDVLERVGVDKAVLSDKLVICLYSEKDYCDFAWKKYID